MKQNIDTTEFELHIAAEAGRFSDKLANGLQALGFRSDALVGHGVVFNAELGRQLSACPLTGLHMTWDSFDREEFVSSRNRLDELLRQCDDCTGYAHGEVIKPEWDLAVDYHPFIDGFALPVARFDASLSQTQKRWDIHISIRRDHLDDSLHEALFEKLGMYYIDLLKRGGHTNRVFTIQGTNTVKEGLKLFAALYSWLQRAGGMEGSIKFEETCYWKNFGNPQIIPPIVESIRFLDAASNVADLCEIG